MPNWQTASIQGATATRPQSNPQQVTVAGDVLVEPGKSGRLRYIGITNGDGSHGDQPTWVAETDGGTGGSQPDSVSDIQTVGPQDWVYIQQLGPGGPTALPIAETDEPH